MEKQLYTASATILCTCSSQWLLTPGTHCEVCMGIVPEPMENEEKHEPAVYDQFDLNYFEALERMFESFEFAA
jgi:hypothetical protein